MAKNVAALVLLCALIACAAPAAIALDKDGFRLGVLLGGTGLAGITFEYLFSDNAVSANLGIFDAWDEPSIGIDWTFLPGHSAGIEADLGIPVFSTETGPPQAPVVSVLPGIYWKMRL
jgi:hypothetical protein